MQRWWNPWLLPVILLGAVALVSRPALGVLWVAGCVGAGRLINGYLAYIGGRTAPGTHPYLRKPS